MAKQKLNIWTKGRNEIKNTFVFFNSQWKRLKQCLKMKKKELNKKKFKKKKSINKGKNFSQTESKAKKEWFCNGDFLEEIIGNDRNLSKLMNEPRFESAIFFKNSSRFKDRNWKRDGVREKEKKKAK